MRVLRTGLSIVSILVAAAASAGPAPFGQGGRDAVRSWQTQASAPEQQLPQQAQDERRRAYAFPAGSSGSSQSLEPSSTDNSRRGRMTPEERRALRRQIDEASHDIDGPSR